MAWKAAASACLTQPHCFNTRTEKTLFKYGLEEEPMFLASFFSSNVFDSKEWGGQLCTVMGTQIEVFCRILEKQK
jgi:hypothetical protein